MKAQTFPPLKPKVVLGVAAHTDDLDMMAAGTMAKYADAGAQVHYLILTDGGKGSVNRRVRLAKLRKLRRTEQQVAAEAIKATGVHFLNYSDGSLEITQDLKRDIVRVIRQLQPDVVITFDPTMVYSAEHGYINHADHRAAGLATIDAVYPLARDWLTSPVLSKEGLQPHTVSTLLLINLDKHNFVVDVSDTFKMKLKALEAHASQKTDYFDYVSKWIKRDALSAGKAAGCKYAECFIRIDLSY